MTMHNFALTMDFSAYMRVNDYTITRGLWWNANYPYRRVLGLLAATTGLAEGHPVTVDIPRSLFVQGKVRGDLEDIEVVFLESTDPPSWELLSRDISVNGNFYRITFPLPQDMDADEVWQPRLYVYYGNPYLVSTETRPTYSDASWFNTGAYDDSSVSYTNPGVDWDAGTAYRTHAKATFTFWGPRARVLANTGTDQGIMEVSVDGGEWEEVDLYSDPDVDDAVVFTTDELSNYDRHKIRLRVSGKKNPSSLTTQINIAGFEWDNHATAIDIEEEQYAKLLWSGFNKGGIL